MAIRTTIATHFAWRHILMAGVCLVLGLWGVYDYVYAIPNKERAFHRGQVCRLIKDALEPGGWNESARPARVALDDAMQRIISENMTEDSLLSNIDPDELRTMSEAALAEHAAKFEAAIESIRERDDESWLAALLLFDQALKAGQPPVYPLSGVHLLAHDIAEQGIQSVANVSEPRRWDRPVQWAFILCLPFVPYSLWMFFSTRARVYRLDDEGTLHMPEGSWAVEDIADINMDRWMSKSIAQVVHSNGTRVLLDDYKHKNLHLIVGAIASRLYPDQWDAEAKVVKKQAETKSPAPEASAEPALSAEDSADR